MYDNPLVRDYWFTGQAFNGADIVKRLKNPRKGSKGKVRSVEAVVTTTCAGATTTPKVQIGDGTTANKYADVALGTTAAGSSVMARDYAGGIKALADGAYVLTDSDGDLVVTLKAATGAGAAGVADIGIVVEWL